MRTHEEWKVETHMILARLPTRSWTRSFISAAALLVKVIARIEPGWALRSEISHAMRRVSTRVLPEPAPATTSSGRTGVRHGRPLGVVETLEERVVDQGCIRGVGGAHVVPTLCGGWDSRGWPGQAWTGDQKTATPMLMIVSASRPK